jgi:hypothetical protein
VATLRSWQVSIRFARIESDGVIARWEHINNAKGKKRIQDSWRRMKKFSSVIYQIVSKMTSDKGCSGEQAWYMQF